MRLPVNRSLPLIALVLLSACGGAPRHVAAVPPPANGPAADYPMVLGPAFTVEGVTYTPADTWNYDAVGHALVGSDGGSAVSGGHRTLPLPSYVEVTALATGKTVLVRLERRGPMSGRNLLELSPGAAAQMGIAGQTDASIRMRRVNPPELDRALLRSGQNAPARLDTPKSLLVVLQRKLDLQEGKPVVAAAPEAETAARPELATNTPKPEVKKPEASKPGKGKPKASPKPLPTVAASDPAAVAPTPVVEPKARPEPKPAAKPAATPGGSLVVQIGAYSSEDRAKAAAVKSGGQVAVVGKLWRVRSGPYATKAEADAALAKARAAGYGDARIQRGN